ncbi:hypothetical protein [Planomonospora parontospora]|uniref:hypothetical protein n=1 Tax=Planomonospora parontospora TaxID=58119 RepID=UPI0016714B8F|nr:hypothetical protein [Planomonospora parontospora]
MDLDSFLHRIFTRSASDCGWFGGNGALWCCHRRYSECLLFCAAAFLAPSAINSTDSMVNFRLKNGIFGMYSHGRGSSFVLAALLTFVGILSLGGCAISLLCDSEAKKYFAATSKAIEMSLEKKWIKGYNELSGCDSYDDPSVSIWLVDDLRSLDDVSRKMQQDGWEVISGGLELEKTEDGIVLIARIVDSPLEGKVIELLPGE